MRIRVIGRICVCVLLLWTVADSLMAAKASVGAKAAAAESADYSRRSVRHWVLTCSPCMRHPLGVEAVRITLLDLFRRAAQERELHRAEIVKQTRPISDGILGLSRDPPAYGSLTKGLSRDPKPSGLILGLFRDPKAAALVWSQTLGLSRDPKRQCLQMGLSRDPKAQDLHRSSLAGHAGVASLARSRPGLRTSTGHRWQNWCW